MEERKSLSSNLTRIIGLDVGERRIGIAISDPLGISAQRLTVINRREPEDDASVIMNLVNEKGAQAVVVGLPITMKGELGEQAKKVMSFIDILKGKLCCPVHVVDERLTTIQGERALISMDTRRKKRKDLIDQLAAQLILQSYLDAQSKK